MKAVGLFKRSEFVPPFLVPSGSTITLYPIEGKFFSYTFNVGGTRPIYGSLMPGPAPGYPYVTPPPDWVSIESTPLPRIFGTPPAGSSGVSASAFVKFYNAGLGAGEIVEHVILVVQPPGTGTDVNPVVGPCGGEICSAFGMTGIPFYYLPPGDHLVNQGTNNYYFPSPTDGPIGLSVNNGAEIPALEPAPIGTPIKRGMIYGTPTATNRNLIVANQLVYSASNSAGQYSTLLDIRAFPRPPLVFGPQAIQAPTGIGSGGVYPSEWVDYGYGYRLNGNGSIPDTALRMPEAVNVEYAQNGWSRIMALGERNPLGDTSGVQSRHDAKAYPGFIDFNNTGLTVAENLNVFGTITSSSAGNLTHVPIRTIEPGPNGNGYEGGAPPPIDSLDQAYSPVHYVPFSAEKTKLPVWTGGTYINLPPGTSYDFKSKWIVTPQSSGGPNPNTLIYEVGGNIPSGVTKTAWSGPFGQTGPTYGILTNPSSGGSSNQLKRITFAAHVADSPNWAPGPLNTVYHDVLISTYSDGNLEASQKPFIQSETFNIARGSAGQKYINVQNLGTTTGKQNFVLGFCVAGMLESRFTSSMTAGGNVPSSWPFGSAGGGGFRYDMNTGRVFGTMPSSTPLGQYILRVGAITPMGICEAEWTINVVQSGGAGSWPS